MIKSTVDRLLRAGILVLTFAMAIFVAGCTSSSSKPVTYTSDVGAVLSQECVSCHNPNGSAKSVPLDTYDNVKATVNPGDASGSRLIKSVDGGSMSGKASGDEVDMLKNWVNQGAKK